MFRQPYLGRLRTVLGQDLAVSGDYNQVGLEIRELGRSMSRCRFSRAGKFSGCNLYAASLIGLAASLSCRPTGRSGCVTTAEHMMLRHFREGVKRGQADLARADKNDAHKSLIGLRGDLLNDDGAAVGAEQGRPRGASRRKAPRVRPTIRRNRYKDIHKGPSRVR